MDKYKFRVIGDGPHRSSYPVYIVADSELLTAGVIHFDNYDPFTHQLIPRRDPEWWNAPLDPNLPPIQFVFGERKPPAES